MGPLEEIIRRLIQAGVAFVVIGGYAAVVHGAVDLTRDVDVCLPFDEANLLKLQTALSDLHPRHRLTLHHAPLTLEAGHCQGWRNLYLATDSGIIDCLGEVLGVGGFDEVLAASEAVSTPIGVFRILTIPALMVAKEAVGRPHDLRTVAELRCLLDIRRHTPPPIPL
jgi:hypothetical protein